MASRSAVGGPTEREKQRNCSTPVPKHHVFKAVLTGKYGVGKTSLFLRLRSLPVPNTLTSTSGMDKFDHFAATDEEPVKLTVWDTAGMERNRSLTDGYYRNCHAIILVFDLTDRDTMHCCKEIARDVVGKTLAPHAKYFLIANKTDVASGSDIKPESVDGFIQSFENIKISDVFYTSALSDETEVIHECFSSIARMLIGMRRQSSGRSYNLEFQNRTKKKSSCC